VIAVEKARWDGTPYVSENTGLDPAAIPSQSEIGGTDT
jgi:hypothetical protein